MCNALKEVQSGWSLSPISRPKAKILQINLIFVHTFYLDLIN
jgi:hypothetical protein